MVSAALAVPAHRSLVGPDGQPPLPWLGEAVRSALASQRGHALLIQGPPGVGQFALALVLAQAWLCEAPGAARRPCGTCASCHLMQAHSHPDLIVLLPEAQRDALGWGKAEDGEGDAAGDEKSGKRKPSKDIRVEEVRRVVGFAQTTSARGRGKVAVLFPAERMNTVAANTLLKTLEEPPGNARFVLAGGAADALLPTIRSRCQTVPLGLPDAATASAWLAAQAVAEPAVLLQATGGQPEQALAWAQDGISARAWLELPAQLRRGDASALAVWPLARVVDALLKLCHDALRLAAFTPPRFFPEAALPPRAAAPALLAWQAELLRVARHAEHPWNAGLLLEALAQQAAVALRPAPGSL